MGDVHERDRKHVLAERLKHLEAELNGALEAVAAESMAGGEMLPELPGDGMTKTIRDLEEQIERLRRESEGPG